MQHTHAHTRKCLLTILPKGEIVFAVEQMRCSINFFENGALSEIYEKKQKKNNHAHFQPKPHAMP